jgi:hypothetical protein
MIKILLSPRKYKTMYQLIKQLTVTENKSALVLASPVCIDIFASKDITKNISLIFRDVFKSSYIEDMTFIFEW